MTEGEVSLTQEFSRLYSPEDLEEGTTQLQLVANDMERAALAKRFGLYIYSADHIPVKGGSIRFIFSRKKSLGISTQIPAPSPDLPSASTAPLCQTAFKD